MLKGKKLLANKSDTGNFGDHGERKRAPAKQKGSNMKKLCNFLVSALVLPATK